MQVKEVVDGKEYYAPGSEYENRPDCIYEWNGQGFKWKEGAKYHSESHLKRDLGEPDSYKRAKCLVGDCFVYFGGSGNPNDIDRIRDIYDRLPRDYQNYSEKHDKEYGKLREFIKSILWEYGCGAHGKPTHS